MKRETMKMLLSRKPAKQEKPKKPHRTRTEILTDTILGWLLDLLKKSWENERWKPKG